VTDREALLAAWRRSDELFATLAPEALLARPIPLRQPFLFYLGHLPAFAWNQLGRGELGLPAFRPELDVLFERGIDPPDDANEAAGESAAWPAPAAVLEYGERVREALRPTLGEPRIGDVLPMVVEHELMHHETLLYMVQQLAAPLKSPPAGLARLSGSAPAPERIAVPAGRAVLGAVRDGRFRWDNEHPVHAVDAPAFAIDRTPVTNRDFLGFVEAGGYRERRFWSDDGWRWRERSGLDQPLFWRLAHGELRVATTFGEVPFEVAADWPACTSHCTASAYARWRGGRLPSETEFHRAAFGSPDGSPREHPWGDAAPASAHGNFGFLRFEPTPVGSHPAGASAFGVHELVGNGWEWTATPFRPFPGFEPQPRYPGYSTDFFDERHLVLLGASWATDVRLVRRSFRNWFQPHYPYVFAKFRCVWPA